MAGQGGRAVFDVVFTPHPAILARAFFMAADKLEQIEVPLEQIAHLYSQEMVDNFEAEGRPPWAELTEATIARKESEGYGNKPILQRTGKLFSAAGTTSNWAIEKQGTGQAAAFFVDPTEYGKFHLTGTKWMVPRDWASTPEEVDEQIDEILQGWIAEAFEAVP